MINKLTSKWVLSRRAEIPAQKRFKTKYPGVYYICQRRSESIFSSAVWNCQIIGLDSLLYLLPQNSFYKSLLPFSSACVFFFFVNHRTFFLIFPHWRIENHRTTSCKYWRYKQIGMRCVTRSLKPATCRFKLDRSPVGPWSAHRKIYSPRSGIVSIFSHRRWRQRVKLLWGQIGYEAHLHGSKHAAKRQKQPRSKRHGCLAKAPLPGP